MHILKKIGVTCLLSMFLIGCTGFTQEAAAPQLEFATIVMGQTYLSRDPFSPVAVDQQFLKPIFEPLVDFDQNYQIVPKLAYTFGQLDETTWEFKIRTNAVFHDGQKVTNQKVEQSFSYAESQEYEHLRELFSNIKAIELPNSESIIFELQTPDPNFLRKITKVPIIATVDAEKLSRELIGTGPYQVKSMEPSLIIYEAETEYWGAQPKINQLTVEVETRAGDRIQKLNSSKEVIAITPFSRQYLNTLESAEVYTLKEVPDLTVNFFLWNDNASNWTSSNDKKIFLDVLPRTLLEKSINGNGQLVSQFVSPGVIGFNPNLQKESMSTPDRQRLITQNGLNDKKIRFAVPESLKTFGLDLEADLKTIGLDAESYVIEPDQVFDNDITQGIDLIFLGWKSDLGTSLTFFENFISQASLYNLGAYANTTADTLLRNAQSATTLKEQQEQLQKLMAEVVDTQPLGVPLFSSQKGILQTQNVDVITRLDGLILFEQTGPR